MKSRDREVAVLFFALIGCPEPQKLPPQESDTDSDTDADSDSDTDTDADSDSDTDADTDPLPVPPGCGDLLCDVGEICGNCPVDCGPCAASCAEDGLCIPAAGESCPSCPADCDQPAICGNGRCDAGEDPSLCMFDCGPLSWPTEWALAEDLLLAAINTERAAGRDCDGIPYGPAAALQSVPALLWPARAHAWDQGISGYYDHDSCDGRTLTDRAPSALHESLSFGFVLPQSAAQSWLSGPDCGALMDGAYAEAGVGHVDLPDGPLWVLLLR